jgi:carnitine 3-dehydrogenase
MRPEQIMVAHPFNPVYLLPLIELVTTNGDADLIEKAKATLTSLGMHPLHLKKEIDAHVADRFLEAVWREALWLVKDGIATTEEIDDAIRYGFGLRWGQMGLFETFRIAGGEAGMEHFIAQFGPCLKWPWTKLMDVPELTDELTKQIADQSNAQSGHMTIRELEQKRDNNLVAMMRALKGQDAAAGALINQHQAQLVTHEKLDYSKLIQSINRTVPVDWTDYNGHMNESRYGQVFSDAADGVLLSFGVDADYVASGLSYFTVEIEIKFILETHAGQHITVDSQILLGEGKKLKLFHRMLADDGTLLATGEQFLLHVSLETRRTCDPAPKVKANLEAAALAHAKLPAPE